MTYESLEAFEEWAKGFGCDIARHDTMRLRYTYISNRTSELAWAWQAAVDWAAKREREAIIDLCKKHSGEFCDRIVSLIRSRGRKEGA